MSIPTERTTDNDDNDDGVNNDLYAAPLSCSRTTGFCPTDFTNTREDGIPTEVPRKTKAAISV